MNISKIYNNFNTIKISLNLLSDSDKKHIMLFAILQVIINVLDILGIIIMGVVGALLAKYVVDSKIPEPVFNFMRSINLQNMDIKIIIFIFCLLAAVLFIVKSLLNLIVNFYLYKFLGNCQSLISSNIVKTILNSSFLWFRDQNLQNINHIVFRSSDAAISFVIVSLLNLIADAALLILMMMVLFIVDPLTTLFTVTLFGLVSYFLQKKVGEFVTQNGKLGTISEIKSREHLMSALNGYRELNIYENKSYFHNKFISDKSIYSKSFNKNLWLQIIPRNIFEITLIAGAAIISFLLILQNDIETVAGALLIFLSSAGRALPSLLRIQSGFFLIKSSSFDVQNLHYFLEDLKETSSNIQSDLRSIHLDSAPEVVLNDLTFCYPDSQVPIFNNLSMRFEQNKISAIVGPSGSGKSTLVNLLLGIYKPGEGEIILKSSGNNFPPSQVKNIAFVSQSPYLFPGTIAENIALGESAHELDHKAYEYAILASGLIHDIDNLNYTFSANINSIEEKLNRGFKQKICIARALYFKPKLLIIDEGTSSLDPKNESTIIKSLKKYESSSTIIVVTHRLSSIESANTVFYLKNGQLLGEGKFSELQRIVPEFGLQVTSMKIE